LDLLQFGGNFFEPKYILTLKYTPFGDKIQESPYSFLLSPQI
jgi:hypothetical protein